METHEILAKFQAIAANVPFESHSKLKMAIWQFAEEWGLQCEMPDSEEEPPENDEGVQDEP